MLKLSKNKGFVIHIYILLFIGLFYILRTICFVYFHHQKKQLSFLDFVNIALTLGSIFYIIFSNLVLLNRLYINCNKLKRIAYKDQFTRLYNRNFYNNILKNDFTKKIYGKSLGLILCDLNGLKKLNDEKGHDEGDRYIKRFAFILLYVFDNNYVIRIGGDEFLVLKLNTNKTEMDDCISRLKRLCAKNNVSFSYGFKFYNNFLGSLETACKKVDEKMYINKKVFYKKRGY